MSLQARATDVLDRLDDCGNGAGVVESDLLGRSVRQPFRRACQTLAEHLLHVSQSFSDASKVASAVVCVRQAAGSERSARDNLDAALLELLNALDPTDKSSVRLEVMERLTSFLQSARLLEFKKDKERKQKMAANGSHNKNVVGPADEDPLAVSDALRALAAVAGAKKNEHKKAIDLLETVEAFAGSTAAKLPREFFSPVVKSGNLDGEQMDTLGEIHEHLTNQYTVQRRVLIERAVVTLQSFLWSKRLEDKGTVKDVEKIVADGRAAMVASPQVSVSSLFTTTYGDVAAVAQKATSGSEGKFEASVKSVIIGKVPDRGGRPEGRAAEAYAANMPAFSSRSTADQHRDAGRGGGGFQDGGRGGRGGFNDGGRGSGRGGFSDGGRGGRGGFSDGGRGGRGGFSDGGRGGRGGFSDGGRGGRGGFSDGGRGGRGGFSDGGKAGFHDGGRGGRGRFNDGGRGGRGRFNDGGRGGYGGYSDGGRGRGRFHDGHGGGRGSGGGHYQDGGRGSGRHEGRRGGRVQGGWRGGRDGGRGGGGWGYGGGYEAGRAGGYR